MDDLNSPLSIIYIVAILFAAGLFLFLGFFAFNTINDALLDSGHFDEREEAKEVIEQVQGYGNLMDYAYLFFILAFLLAMPIAAYFTPSHPSMFVAFIFIFFIALTLSVVFSDTFIEIGESDEMEDTYSQMPLLRNLMYYLPLLIIINGVVTGSIMFGKARAGAGEY